MLSEDRLCWQISTTYRVGSVNFSQRKIGQAHHSSADSENVAGARETNVHAHFNFGFENGQGNQSFFFLSMTKYSCMKRVNHKLGRWTIDAPSTGRTREASSGPEESLVQHSLVENRQASWIEESFWYEVTNLKKPNTTDLERYLQRPRLRRSTIDRRRRT